MPGFAVPWETTSIKTLATCASPGGSPARGFYPFLSENAISPQEWQALQSKNALSMQGICADG
jgi:hypothetical protein